MSGDGKFKLTISGNGLSLDQEVDQATALSIMNIALGGQACVQAPINAAPTSEHTSPPKQVQSAAPERATPPQSLREHVHDLGPRTNPDIILSIASFITKRDHRDHFTKDEIKALFPKAGEALPKNYSRDFNNVGEWGWIAEDPERDGHWYITTTGEAALDTGFSREARKTTSRARRRPKSNLTGEGSE